MLKPSPRELELLRCIVARHTVAVPTDSELAELLGISQQGVNRKILSLQEKGYVTRTPGIHRSLTITSEGFEVVSAE